MVHAAKQGNCTVQPAGETCKTIFFFSVATVNNILQSKFILFKDLVASCENFIYINDLENDILSINILDKTGNIINTGGNKIFALTCTQNKLYLVAENKMECINISDGKLIKHINLNTIINENDANSSVCKIAQNKLLISINKHLYEFDTNCVFHYEITDLNRNPFLTTGDIHQAYADKFNRIWLLTNNDIQRIQNVELPFEHFIYPFEKNNFVRSLYYDEQKHVLIAGCFNGGIQLYDTLSNPLWQKPIISADVKDILAIEKINTDEYLLITFGKGWYVLNLLTKQIRSFYIGSSIKNILQPTHVNFSNNLQHINDTTIFIATANNVYECIFKRSSFVSASPLLKINNDGNIGCFLYAKNKIMWAGTNTGLVYRLSNGNMNTIQIPNNYIVRSMAEDKEQNIWVGTDKGLYVYNNAGSFIKKISMETGLRNDCIYSILPTNDNAFFAGTNLGLSYISLNGTVRNFSKEMGLQENEFNTGSACKTQSGKLYFGGVNGITAFYPASLSVIKDSPLIHITQLVVNDSSFNASSGIWHGDSVLLNYKQNRLHFDIAAMGMLNVNEYVYQYRLTGLDTTWQTTYQPTNINYTLQPGNYTLEIKCHSLLSSGEEFSKNFYILIAPPFWQTWWFRIIAFLCITGAIYFFIYRYNRDKYLKKIRMLETQQQIQTERERISRELHDNIGSQLSFIISNIDWTIDSAERMTKDEEMQRLQSINSTAKNVMSNLRESIWALNKEKITLEEFADKLKAYIQNIIALKPGLEFISKEDVKTNISFSPTETLNIFRICQEVITNVIKHASATCLKIFIASDAEQKFSILIEDNGKGFNVSGNMKGYGLENIQYRAEEMKLSLDVQSQEGKGTSVLISK